MTRPARLLALALLGTLVGCASGSGCSGCGALEPIPGGQFVGEKIDDAMTVRISSDGVGVLNWNWQVLLAQFAPGNQMKVPLGCMVQSVSIPLLPALKIVVADQGTLGCASESCGLMDGVCDSRDLPTHIQIDFHGLVITPKAPDVVEGTLDMTLSTGKIYLDSESRSSALCLFSSPLKCGLDFDSSRAAPANNTFQAGIRFTVNPRWDKLLSFEVASIGGSKMCGTSGAAPKPNCIDSADILITVEGACATCTAAQFDPIKALIIDQVVGSLKTSIQEALDQGTCQRCGGALSCPQLPPAASTCQAKGDAGLCIDTGTNKCVPSRMGVEGRMAAATMLAGLGAPQEAMLDISIAAGGSASCDTGINIGIRGGTQESAVADCVKQVPAPALVSLPAPAFDSAAPDGGYDVGLAVSRQFLDQALHHAEQSGVMCISLSGASVAQLSSGLFKPIIPSLGKLTPKGEDVPMMVVLRPGAPPTVTVGEGTYDPATNKPIDPLLTLTMKGLGVDFYALLEDRQVRLFTLTSDVSLPFSLILEGCSSITPALGSLTGAITNVKAENSEILAENLTALESLIPMFIGLAEPQLAGGAQPFSLPPFGAFKLQPIAAKGLTPISGTTGYQHLGLYTKLLRSYACAISAPLTRASLLRSQMPRPDEVLARGRALPWPKAVLTVSVEGAAGTPEFATRINGGLWSEFARAGEGGELEVSHPAFLLQGRHRIEVRSRLAENPRGISAPVEVGFSVDFAPPEVAIEVDRAGGRLVIHARDSVSTPEALRFSYRLGTENWTEYGPAREVFLDDVDAAGGLSVRVKDELENVGEAAYRVPVVAERPESAPAIADRSASGCSSAGGEFAAGALMLLIGVFRRARARVSRGG